jgi:hypothetical protein
MAGLSFSHHGKTTGKRDSLWLIFVELFFVHSFGSTA